MGFPTRACLRNRLLHPSISGRCDDVHFLNVKQIGYTAIFHVFPKLTVCKKKTVFEPVSFMLLEAWGLKVLEYQSSPNIDISSKHRNNYAIYGCFPFGIFYILAGFSISMLVYWMYKNKTYKSRQYEAT